MEDLPASPDASTVAASPRLGDDGTDDKPPRMDTTRLRIETETTASQSPPGNSRPPQLVSPEGESAGGGVGSLDESHRVEAKSNVDVKSNDRSATETIRSVDIPSAPYLYGSTVTNYVLFLDWLFAADTLTDGTRDEFLFWNQIFAILDGIFLTITSSALFNLLESQDQPSLVSTDEGLDENYRQIFGRVDFFVFAASFILLFFAVLLHMLQMVAVRQCECEEEYLHFRTSVGDSSLVLPFTCGFGGIGLIFFGTATRVVIQRERTESAICCVLLFLLIIVVDYFHRNVARSVIMAKRIAALRKGKKAVQPTSQEGDRSITCSSPLPPPRTYLVEEISAEEIYSVLKKYYFKEHQGNLSNLSRADFVQHFDEFGSESTTMLAGTIYDRWMEQKIESMIIDPGF